jgi:hypothetical protein
MSPRSSHAEAASERGPAVGRAPFTDGFGTPCAAGPPKARAAERRRSQRIPSSSSAGEVSPRPWARITSVSRRGERLQRSRRLISVRCRLHASASASCERPDFSRCVRRFCANWLRICSTDTRLLSLVADERSTDLCLLRRNSPQHAHPCLGGPNYKRYRGQDSSRAGAYDNASSPKTAGAAEDCRGCRRQPGPPKLPGRRRLPGQPKTVGAAEDSQGRRSCRVAEDCRGRRDCRGRPLDPHTGRSAKVLRCMRRPGVSGRDGGNR